VVIATMRSLAKRLPASQKAAAKPHISEAIAIEKSGAEVVMKSAAQFDAPPEFQERLDDDPKLAEAFHALTPEGRKVTCCISLGQSNRRLAARAWKSMCRGY
jgi:uncharacterized protein YdeI (YjbR/CyaY-like superfamily)